MVESVGPASRHYADDGLVRQTLRQALAPNTRETVRRQTVHQFMEAGIIIANPDDPARPINSPDTVYQVETGAMELLRTYRTKQWEKNLRTWLTLVETLKAGSARAQHGANPVDTGHGPVDGKRHNELKRLFAACKAGLVFVHRLPGAGHNGQVPGRHLVGNGSRG